MKQNYRCDVCIVGCGVAGSVLAYNLDPEVSTIVVERKSLDELGKDPCGNAVHKSWFEETGVEPKPEDYGAIASLTNSVRLNLPEETLEAKLEGSREGLVIKKDDYIKGVAEKALDDGAEMINGSAKPILDNNEIEGIEIGDRFVEAGIYVDASGPVAVLRKKFFQIPQGGFFRGYNEVFECDQDLRSWQLHQFDYESAYWAFPHDGKLNLGGVAFREGANLKEGVEKVKKAMGVSDVSVRYSGYGQIVSYKPIDLVYGNVVAVGDAGVNVNPVTGGGIGPSVKAANILAEIINQNKPLKEFQERYMEEVAGNYEKLYYLSRVMRKIQRISWEWIASWAFKKFYNAKPLEE